MLSGKVKLRWIVPGKVPATPQSMTFDGKSYPGTMVKEYTHWSLWEAEVDTALGNDGVIPASFSGGPVTLFTVANGKDDANFEPLTGCKLRLNSSGAKIPLELYWNGELLKKLDPVKPGAMTEIPLSAVKRMNKLEIRVPKNVKSGKSAYRCFRIARPKGADIHDLRIDWNTVTLDAIGSRSQTLYFGVQK